MKDDYEENFEEDEPGTQEEASVSPKARLRQQRPDQESFAAKAKTMVKAAERVHGLARDIFEGLAPRNGHLRVEVPPLTL